MGTIAIICGLLTAGLALLDLLLPEGPKKSVNHWIAVTWNLLDDAKRVSLVSWLCKPGFRVWFAAAAGVMGGWLIVWGLIPDFKQFSFSVPELEYFGCAFASFVLGSFLGRLVLMHVLAGGNALTATVRMLFSCLIFLLVVPICFLSAAPPGLLLAAVDTDSWFWHRGSVPIDLILIFLAVNTLCVIYSFWLVATLPYLLVSSIQSVVFISEFLTRRMAEYSKGALLAVSTIFLAIGTIIKVFF